MTGKRGQTIAAGLIPVSQIDRASCRGLFDAVGTVWHSRQTTNPCCSAYRVSSALFFKFILSKILAR